MIFRLKNEGNWNKTFKWLNGLSAINLSMNEKLHDIGRRGVKALEDATPVYTGLTSKSWDYRIFNGDVIGVEWHNYDIEGGCNVAILIEYGHGLRQGGYVAPNPFINETMEPIFNSFAEEIWREVDKL